jgi:LEA14-like dessication related protein
MISLSWIRSAWLLMLGACTPLGLWLYEDPVVSVYRITLERRASRAPGSSPVVVVLAVQNRNDYPLSTERLELSLHLDGVPIGRIKRDSTAPVGTNTVSTLALALPLEKQATSARLDALVTGSHIFAVRGRATFRTPIGSRKVSFAEEGEMIFGQRRSDSLP